jgi:hypothetical protein
LPSLYCSTTFTVRQSEAARGNPGKGGLAREDCAPLDVTGEQENFFRAEITMRARFRNRALADRTSW